MSLINDALRRAGEADRRRRGSLPPLSPLQRVQGRRHGRGIQGLAVLLILCLGAATWLLYRSNQPAAPNRSSRLDPLSEAPVRTVPTPLATVPAPPSSAAPTYPAVGELPPAPEVARPDPVPQVTPPSEIRVSTDLVVRPAPSGGGVEFPSLKLQSIIFRVDRPEAMINSATVYAGDLVEGVRVVRITRDSVVVEYQGSNRVLRLTPL